MQGRWTGPQQKAAQVLRVAEQQPCFYFLFRGKTPTFFCEDGGGTWTPKCDGLRGKTATWSGSGTREMCLVPEPHNPPSCSTYHSTAPSTLVSKAWWGSKAQSLLGLPKSRYQNLYPHCPGKVLLLSSFQIQRIADCTTLPMKALSRPVHQQYWSPALIND